MSDEGTLQNLVDTLTEELEAIGLHADFVRVVGSQMFEDEDSANEDMESHSGVLSEDEMIDRIKAEEGEFCLAVRARTKKKAWTRKVLKPKEYAADQEFKSVGLTAREMAADSIRQQLADGVDPSDVDLSLFTLGLHSEEEESESEETFDNEDWDEI